MIFICPRCNRPYPTVREALIGPCCECQTREQTTYTTSTMTPLHEIPTPLTDAIHEGRRDRYLGGTVPFEFARDLERKLALCRKALKSIEGYGCQEATRALAATEPKP